MAASQAYRLLKGSEHAHHHQIKPATLATSGEIATVTLILRRRAGSKPHALAEFSEKPRAALSRSQFAGVHGADPKELAAVEDFARAHHLEVMESHPAARSVVVRGTVANLNTAFGVTLHEYHSPRGKYRGHEGSASLPDAVADMVETVTGLDNRQVPAKHYLTARRHPAGVEDPHNTVALTPQQVASLYDFPPGTGAGQTIGIYEMQTGDGSPGYSAQDLALTMQAFGGGLTVPIPIDVAVDGVTNTHVSDGETVLDITVASAVAQGAKIAVYFAGGTTQSIIHALQRMIHPGAGDPQPSILSISYGWGPDDAGPDSMSDQEYAAIGQLFQDAANLGITVLVSSGDSGAFMGDKSQAQASYPATEPWVVACGGTTIGNVNGRAFEEYVWNDTWQGGAGATGGGISARFPVPPYQSGVKPPARRNTRTPGRGIPDISGNASVNSGYPIAVGGKSPGTTGGTSAVAPLFAGLIARINANLAVPVGFITPVLYTLPAATFRDIAAPPGPADNSFNGTAGYPAEGRWNACTGLGSVNGTALQEGLRTAHAPAPGKVAAAVG